MSRPVELVRAALRKPELKGAAPSQAELATEQAALQSRHEASLARVADLVRGHEALSSDVKGELAGALETRASLEAMAARDAETGVLASITRALTRRRAILERKSAAETLVTQFRAVQESLARASAFSDELRLCALELQAGLEDEASSLDRLLEEAAAAAREQP